MERLLDVWVTEHKFENYPVAGAFFPSVPFATMENGLLCNQKDIEYKLSGSRKYETVLFELRDSSTKTVIAWFCRRALSDYGCSILIRKGDLRMGPTELLEKIEATKPHCHNGLSVV